jgi:Kef-type K+ transport system membrane component KefB
VPRPIASPRAATPVIYEMPVARRSNAAIPAVAILVLVGLYLAQFSVLIPGLIGLVLFSVFFSFVGQRINPLSTSFYSHVKPSGIAIAFVFFGAIGMLYAAYALYLRHYGPLLPHF